jgi:hypothetical protein
MAARHSVNLIAPSLRAESLASLVKTRGFGMTPLSSIRVTVGGAAHDQVRYFGCEVRQGISLLQLFVGT